MLCGREQCCDAGRVDDTPHVHRLGTDVRIELHLPPLERVRNKVRRTGKEAELFRVRQQAVVPIVARLPVLGPLPGEVERLFQCAEGDVEHHRDFRVCGEVLCFLVPDPRELRHVDAFEGKALGGVGHDVRGGGEDAVDERRDGDDRGWSRHGCRRHDREEFLVESLDGAVCAVLCTDRIAQLDREAGVGEQRAQNFETERELFIEKADRHGVPRGNTA